MKFDEEWIPIALNKGFKEDLDKWIAPQITELYYVPSQEEFYNEYKFEEPFVIKNYIEKSNIDFKQKF